MIKKIIEWFKTPCRKDPEIQAFLRYANEVQRKREREERRKFEENKKCLLFEEIDSIGKVWIEDLRNPQESDYQVVERRNTDICYYHKTVNTNQEVMEFKYRHASTYGIDWVAYRRRPNWYPPEDREK